MSEKARLFKIAMHQQEVAQRQAATLSTLSEMLGCPAEEIVEKVRELRESAEIEDKAEQHWEECQFCGTGSTFNMRNGCGLYMNMRRDAEIKRKSALCRPAAPESEEKQR